MRHSSRVIASLLGLTLSLTACGGQNSSLPSMLSSSGGPTAESSVRSASPDKPLIAVPKLYGALSYTDAGRRAADAPVRVSVTLRYNHQGELDRFVANISDPRSGSRRHFLTAKEFNEHFAPTPEQERRVVRELERAGFKIEKRYPNRTIVDATARTATVERFFSTEIHAVSQGKYGDRYTNVTPATVPKAIASLVRDVSARTTSSSFAPWPIRAAAERNAPRRSSKPIPKGGRSMPMRRNTPLDSTGQLVNGGFASGSLSPGWINESTTAGNDVSVTTAQAHSEHVLRFHGVARTAGDQRLGLDRARSEGPHRWRPELLGLPGLQRGHARLRHAIRVARRVLAQLARLDSRSRSTKPSTTRTGG